MTPRPEPRDETGAALVIALIFITVVAMVTAVVLSFADASLRATTGLHQQATEAYAADGAAQVAINNLRTGSFTNDSGQRCFGGTNTLSLPEFPTAAAGSAVVECTPDVESGSASEGTLSQANVPQNAILTLGDTSTQESGVLLASVNNSDALSTAGQIRSNSSILVQRGALTSDAGITALKGYCFHAARARVSCGSAGPEADPSYPVDAGTATPRSVPACPKSGGLVTFQPGLYTDAAALSACSGDTTTMWFQPGTYYFDFTPDAPTWSMDAGSLVAGTPTVDLSSTVPPIPGSCVSPLTSTQAHAGVQFVFGGVSNLAVGKTAQVELCGSYSRRRPPIAVYGLKSALGRVSGESGCITAEGGCPLISSSDFAAASMLYVQGTVYAPRASLALSYGKSPGLDTGQFVSDGIVARSVNVLLDGVSPVGVSVPDQTAGPRSGETDVLLRVYVCAGQPRCRPDRGRLQLEATVGISDPQSQQLLQSQQLQLQQLQSLQTRLSTGLKVNSASDDAAGLATGARTVQILSWAVKRCPPRSSARCQA
jgi:hypothetical protein